MPKAIVQPITNFTTRDGLFLLAALIALLLSLREGQIQVNLIPLWRIPIQRDETRVRGKGDRQISHLPGPLVSDLDGGGLNDIIVVDSKCGLRLFRVINGVLSAEKVIRASEMVVKNTGRPVAISAGYLKYYPSSKHERREKVVIVVRDDWLVRCFDSQLSKIMWERYTSHTDRLSRDRMSLYRIYEAATTILPLENNTHVLPLGQMLNENDGVVLVGGSMRLRDDVSAAALGESKQQLQEEERLARAFTVFAMTGATGDKIWEEVDQNMEEKVRKQGNDEEAWKNDDRSPQYKFPKGIYFDKSSLEKRTWPAFKASVLENLPHSWVSPVDTRLNVAKLQLQRRSSKGNEATIESSSSSPVSAVPTSAQLNYAYKPKPDMVMAHTSSGMTAVNLFTGEKLFSLPLSPTSVASEGGDRPEIWGDINGDDVMEHIQVAEKNGNPMDDREDDMNFSNLPACYALVTSGIPAQHVFNGSICDRREAEIVRHHHKHRKFKRRGMWRREAAQDIKAATPLILTKIKSSYYSRTEGHEQATSDVIFAVNLGIITSYSHNGLLNWQIKTGPTWSLSSNGYLSLLPLQSHGTAILAVGDANMMIYDRHGTIISKADVLQPLTKPPIIVDVDGDGMNDIVAVGSDEIVIYKLSRIDSWGSQYLVSGIVLLSLGIIVAHIIGPGGIAAERQRKRATD